MTTYKCEPEFYDRRWTPRPYYQAMYKGKILSGYYFILDGDSIFFVSQRRGGYQRGITANVSGKSKYPKVGVTVDDWGTRKTVHLHQIVAQTFHSYPIPDGVTESEWKRTPKSVRNHFDSQYWEANHIDHNHLNYHPDNLEWVSRGVNVDKYHAHRIDSEYLG